MSHVPLLAPVDHYLDSERVFAAAGVHDQTRAVAGPIRQAIRLASDVHPGATRGWHEMDERHRFASRQLGSIRLDVAPVCAHERGEVPGCAGHVLDREKWHAWQKEIQ